MDDVEDMFSGGGEPSRLQPLPDVYARSDGPVLFTSGEEGMSEVRGSCV